MKQKYLNLREIQIAETEILKSVIKFLNDNKINYFICAGTFLGAVRHKGFIPWDDDVDIAITRPQYNKLINILKQNKLKITDNLFASGFELGNSQIPFIKILNKNIKVDQTIQWEEYLWIDIFPLDAFPKNNKIYYKNLMFYRRLLDLIRVDSNNFGLMTNNPFKKIIKLIFLFILRIWKYDNFINFYIKQCSKYDFDKYDYVRDNVWGDTSSLIHKSQLKNCKYEFEGLKVNSFEDYDNLLSDLYGKDYMKLPPKEKRQNHKFKAWRVK